MAAPDDPTRAAGRADPAPPRGGHRWRRAARSSSPLALAGCSSSPSNSGKRTEPRRRSRSRPRPTTPTRARRSAGTRRAPVCASPSRPSTPPGPREGLRPMALPVRLCPTERARAALRGAEPRAGRPRAAALRRADGGARHQRAEGRRHGRAATATGPRLRVGRRRVDRGGRQRSRRRLPVDVQRRARQRRTRLLEQRRRRAAGPTARSCSSASARVHLVMGAAFDPNGDTSAGDRGGSSLAATLAVDQQPGTYVYSWSDVLAATRAGTLRPLRTVPTSESNAGIADPAHNVLPGSRLHPHLRRQRDRQLAHLHRRRAGRHQSRPRARGHPAHGAAGRLRPAQRAPSSSSWR